MSVRTATGGTVTFVSGYKIHTFTGGGTFTVSDADASSAIDVLIVGGGGGGGGGYTGGGGGAGGFITTSTTISNGTYTVTVGGGGAGGLASGSDGTTGNPSSITGTGLSLTTAVGGGGGGSYPGSNGGAGLAGGSGGGGSYYPSTAGGAGTSGQGNNGGAGHNMSGACGGGGGGAGAVGGDSGATDPGPAGNGGIGLQSSINGTSLYYAGGGGGGTYNGGSDIAGNGGLGGGGGGSGVTLGTSDTSRGATSPTSVLGGVGGPNTGGGGGGGGLSLSAAGGTGGSGIVIIRYLAVANISITPGSFNAQYSAQFSARDSNSGGVYVANTTSTQLSGPFTIEMWVYNRGDYGNGTNSSSTSTQRLLTKGNNAVNDYAIDLTADRRIQFTTGTNSVVAITTGTSGQIVYNGWNHIAVNRSNSSILSITVNGVATTSTVYSNPLDNTNVMYVGRNSTSTNLLSSYYTGYISNLRITNSRSVYGLSKFTPSLSALSTSTSGSTTSTSNSVYFGLTGAYLSFASTATFGFGLGDFTVELWYYPMYPSAGLNNTTANLLDFRNGTNGAGVIQPQLFADNTNGFTWYVAATNRITSTTASYKPGNWTHVAVSRTAGNTKMFINGVQAGTTYVDANNYPAGSLNISSPNDGVNVGTRGAGGFISNVRVTKGTGLYTATFVPATTPLTTSTIGATGTGTVATFSTGSVVLLTCQDVLTIKDNSINSYLTTATGSVIIDYNMGPFAAGTNYSVTPTATSNNNSILFNGSTDLLSIPSLTPAIGTGDFTVEAWVYITSAAGTQRRIWSYQSAGSATVFNLYQVVGGQFAGEIRDSAGAGDTTITSTTIASANIWYHVAFTRASATTRLFVNGIQQATAVTQTQSLGTGVAEIGGSAANSNYFPGYISNLRVVNGTAVYTSAFTPPTSPLTAVTNTVLLTAQATTIIDGSTNAFTITPAGTPSVNKTIVPYGLPVGLLTLQSSSFIDNGPNSISVVSSGTVSMQAKNAVSYGGWSMYFNGTNEYMTLPTNSNYVFAGDFTIEAYVYSPLFNAANAVISYWVSGTASACSFQMVVLNTGYLYFAWGIGATNSTVTGTTRKVTSGAWTHVAVVRIGTTVTLYVNGAADATQATVSGTLNTATGPLYIGVKNPTDGGYYEGMISNLRVVNGVGVYTGAFTPPTYALSTATIANLYGGSNTAAVTTQTVLLTLHNPYLADASVVNATITNGSQLQLISDNSPFTTYSGNSPHFTGTNSLSIADNPVLEIGNNPFTIETWFMPTVLPNAAFQTMISKRSAGTVSTASFSLQISPPDGSYFNSAASSGNYIGIAANSGSTALDFNTGDYTIEFFGMRTGISSFNCPLCWSSAGSVVVRFDSTSINFSGVGYTWTGQTNYNSNPTLFAALGQWFHLAVTRVSGTADLYINGQLLASGADASSRTLNGGRIGSYNNGPNQEWVGYISNLRAVKGVALYSGNYFTPPVNRLSWVPNTVLHCFVNSSSLQSEISPYNNILTVTGTPSVTSVAPGGTYASTGTVKLYASSTSTFPDVAYGVVLGNLIRDEWNHVAVYRTAASGPIYGAVNGIPIQLTTSSTTLLDNTDSWRLGSDASTTNPTYGYYNSWRLIVGQTPTYSTNTGFVPSLSLPTTPTGTRFLVAQGTSVNDLGTFSNTVTTVGVLGIKPISPFPANFVSGSTYFGDVFSAIYYSAGIPDGTSLPYTISGVTGAQINYFSTSGSLSMLGGYATLAIPTVAGTLGTATMSVTINGLTATQYLTYLKSFTLSPTSAIWGQSFTATIITANLSNNTTVPYTIGGITSVQLSGGTTSSNFILNGNVATVSYASYIPTNIFEIATGTFTIPTTTSSIRIASASAYRVNTSTVTPTTALAPIYTNNTDVMSTTTNTEARLTIFSVVTGTIVSTSTITPTTAIAPIYTSQTDIFSTTTNTEPLLTIFSIVTATVVSTSTVIPSMSLIAAPTYAYSSGQDVRITKDAVQSWSI